MLYKINSQHQSKNNNNNNNTRKIKFEICEKRKTKKKMKLLHLLGITLCYLTHRLSYSLILPPSPPHEPCPTPIPNAPQNVNVLLSLA